MIMKKYFIALVILVGLGVFWWLLANRAQKNITQSSATNSQPAQEQSRPVETISQTLQKQQTQLQPATASKPSIPNNVMEEYFKKTEADPVYDWKRPINFWGRVVDESNEPITTVSVHFVWNDTNGTSEADTTSDGNGFFSLTDRKGKGLSVSIGKEGYYGTSSSRQSFEYANPANGLFTPDQMNPVVFHLRKKGLGVDLIVSQNGMSTFMKISPPANGSPVFLDFFAHQVGNSGQLKIEGWKEPKDHKTAQNNWGFRLTVPDGGLVEDTDDLSFEAPDIDYQSVWEWHFTDGAADWQGGINKKYYIKFSNPPRYGTINFNTSAFTPTVYLEYKINPDGSRNLEPK